MTIRILHSGDWHIGRFNGPEKDGKNARFLDICGCLDALVKGAQESRPDITVVAGDVFHAARTWSDRGLEEVETAIRYIRELENICPVVVMRGTPNHDGENHFEMLKTAFEGDDNVHIVTKPGVWTYHSYGGKKVQIACLPGFDRGYYRAQHPGLSKEEENEVFTKAIADMIIGLKAQCIPDIPAVLVSHYTITGCNMESGQTAFLSQFEPVVYPDTLAAADFDLVCFGHIHRPQKIEGCRNTYYCGAVSALNFNDEGQERGYWIHEIGEGAGKSDFRPLPTRQFLTIRLKDEDVVAANSGSYEDLPFNPFEVQEKIVRVLYDCTDEHNKAFNHALLENHLYSLGAFWVQEITPQKITITVDRRSMDADTTPEDNLKDYLEEKGIEPGRVGEIVELARPIIAEVTEKATQERHSGLFVPVEIEVKNYRNYRDERFSFDGIRFCTINGSNGVGKSSLFMDAMLDALFEEPREGELTGWICNAPDVRSGSIKFTFRLGEQTYRVTRTRQKSGKATLNISELVDGEWADRSKEKIRDTQQEIENIIGMDSLTLKACALIMQDQYGLFLQADKEARMDILGSILGLGIYGNMEEAAADRVTETNRSIRSLTDRETAILSGLPDRQQLSESIKAAELRLEALKKDEADRTAEIDGMKVSLNTQLEAEARVIRLNSRISALTASKAAKEANKTAQVAVIASADAVLAEEAQIAEGVARYQTLSEKEKVGIKAKATYDGLKKQKEQLEQEVARAKEGAASARQKKAALTITKIGPISEKLSREEELAGKHAEYERLQEKLASLEAQAPKWEEKKNAVQAAAEALKKAEREWEAKSSGLEIKINTVKGKVELLGDSGCPYPEKATCRFLKDALEAQKELPELEAELEAERKKYMDTRQDAQEALAAAEMAFSEESYDPTEFEAVRSDLRATEPYEKEYNSLEAARNELKIINERLEELGKQEAEHTAAAEKAREELAGVMAQIAEAEEANRNYEALLSEIEAARKWLEKEKMLPVAKERKAAASDRLLELIGEIDQIENEIAESREELVKEQADAVGVEELKRQVSEAEGKIRQIQDEAQNVTITLGGLRKQQEQAAESILQAAELRKQIVALTDTAAGYEELKKAFSQDGIPHNIIRSIIPIFEATATNILGQMSGGKMSVEFVTEKTLKSNSKKEVTTLDIIINDSDTGRLPYMSRSGGERVKAALSVILALSEIKQTKAGVQFGFLFIDEAPYLDGTGTQAYCDALEAIQTRYSGIKVMAITHDESFKARFPQSVTVYKDENGSHVRSD